MNKNLPDGNERAGNPGRAQNIMTWPNLSEAGGKGLGWGSVAGDDEIKSGGAGLLSTW